MNIEILHVKNGFLVRPLHDYRNGTCVSYDTVWVFTDYARMMDKLDEILKLPEPYDARHS